MTIPVAPPPGVIRLKAFPASCVVMTANQLRVPMAMAWTTHTQAYEAIAQTMAGTIHAVCTSPSRPHAANTSPMLGAKKYRQIAVSASTSTRPRNGRLRPSLLSNFRVLLTRVAEVDHVSPAPSSSTSGRIPSGADSHVPAPDRGPVLTCRSIGGVTASGCPFSGTGNPRTALLRTGSGVSDRALER